MSHVDMSHYPPCTKDMQPPPLTAEHQRSPFNLPIDPLFFAICCRPLASNSAIALFMRLRRHHVLKGGLPGRTVIETH